MLPSRTFSLSIIIIIIIKCFVNGPLCRHTNEYVVSNGYVVQVHTTYIISLRFSLSFVLRDLCAVFRYKDDHVSTRH